MTPPKDHNNLPVTHFKDMEVCNLPDKVLKIAVLRKLDELQESTGRQFSKISKTIHKQNVKFNKEIGIIKRTKEKF